MSDDYDDIRKQAEERVKKRAEVKDNLAGFLLIDSLLWIAWFIAWQADVFDRVLSPPFFILVVVTVVWGLGTLGEWYDHVYAADEREERHRREVEEEIERELARRALKEKRKRLMLSDDGELIEFTHDDDPFENIDDEDEAAHH